jgi:L-galactonate dehydratase
MAPEPTNPDDVLGHATIRKALKPYGVGVATGEAAQNRVTFKQLLQAEATDVAQIDAVRLGSVNECLVRDPDQSSFQVRTKLTHLMN